MRDPFANFQRLELSNGLQVHVLHVPDAPFATLEFVIHSGAIQDEPGREGTAHFMEHLVCQNGGSSLQELLEFFELHSGMKPGLGVTGFQSTNYSFTLPTDSGAWKQALGYFGTMLLHAKLEQHIERERQVIRGEFKQRFPLPYEHELVMRERRAVFGDTWFSRTATALGEIESINRITEEDLQRYYDSHYTPANMSIVVVGGCTPAQIRRLLLDSPFANYKVGQRTARCEPRTEVPPPTERTARVSLADHHVEGGTTFDYRSSAMLPGTVPMVAISTFQAMLWKILFKELREDRAWCYGMGSQSFQDPEFRSLKIVADKLQLNALGDISDVIDACVCSVAERDELFELTKLAAINRRKISDMSGEDIRHAAAEDLVEDGKIVSLAEEIAECEQMDMEDIRTIVNHLRPEQRFTLLVTP